MNNENYAPYSTGMTAKQAVDVLWKAYNIDKNFCKIIRQNTPPTYGNIENDCSFWYNESNDKLYRAQRNDTLKLIFWFEV